MAKVAKIVGTVAGILSFIPGPHQPIAAAVALAANMTAAVLQKKPPARGATSQVMIGANMPMPCVVGRSYVGGERVLDAGYGGTVNKVKNPYRSMVDIYSIGPIQQIEGLYADFAPLSFSGNSATGYYSGFLYRSQQVGAQPEASALTGHWGAIPSWSSAHKLSGKAAVLWSLKFDKDGKKFSSGVPQFGAVVKGPKVYDPRLDSTYPGGSGAQLFETESTWSWSENPALHALAYARGRYQNGKKVFGCGFAKGGIDIPAFVELANICDANGWKVGGTLYEPGSKWDNLKRLLQAAGAEPVFVGAKLSVRFNAPRIALDTITADDLADGEYVVPGMKTWRDRMNSIIPKYRSEPHKWEYVQSDAVTVASYVTEDGEEKQEERQYDLVQNKDQAAQLAAYELVNGRELGPIQLPLKPRFIEYRPGEALEGGADLDELGLAGQLMIITGRAIDPATGIVTLTLESETTAKHAFALGRTGTAPPTPSITTGEEMDEVVTENSITASDISTWIRNSYPVGLSVVQGQNVGGDGRIVIGNHERDYPHLTNNLSVTGATLTGLTPGVTYFPYYDDETLADGSPTFGVTPVYGEAINSTAHPYRHDLKRSVTIPASSGGSSGGNYGGGGYGGGFGTDIP